MCNLLMFVYVQFSILVSLLFNLWIAIFNKPTYLLVRIQLRQTCDCFSIAFQSNSLEIDRLSRIWRLPFDFWLAKTLATLISVIVFRQSINVLFFCVAHSLTTTTTTTTIALRPFVRDYPCEPVPEETFTHPPSWSSSNLYQLLLPRSIASSLFKLCA